ncbi:hypothetical protein BDY21DRAFT_352128 [Lineolata rhizophorae]|uniref:Uncharacterized protein n=1 Tax=Lineolata rhizophorae TaxID=578093 RepID=A0A6A6NTG8_9PEZI|nr:hypothetical protein BDY21DRAFT_352128 [Lineolata rhizophorae]
MFHTDFKNPPLLFFLAGEQSRDKATYSPLSFIPLKPWPRLPSLVRNIFRVSFPTMDNGSIQVLNDSYISQVALVSLLRRLFPNGGYKARYKNNRWVIQAPRHLTDEEIESIWQTSTAA